MGLVGFLFQVGPFVVGEFEIEIGVADGDIHVILEIEDLHTAAVCLDAVGGVEVLEDVAALDPAHFAVVGGDGGAIDDDVVVGGAAEADDLAIERKAVWLGIFAGDGDTDAWHGVGDTVLRRNT